MQLPYPSEVNPDAHVTRTTGGVMSGSHTYWFASRVYPLGHTRTLGTLTGSVGWQFPLES